MDHFLFPDELSDLNMVRQELVEYTLHQTSIQSLETLRKLKGYFNVTIGVHISVVCVIICN